MLFLLLRLGKDRYALATHNVVEVLPLVKIKRLPKAPNGVAGVFMYRGTPVPAVDLSQITVGESARELMSTRIIVVNYLGAEGKTHLLGLIAEKVTQLLRKEPGDFINPGIKIKEAPYLGPVLMDAKGPIQWFYEQNLLSGPVQQLLFASPKLIESAAAAAP